jgi:hypothetical protein
MKIHSTDTPTANIVGAKEATEFKFKATPQAAQLLSAGLYSDPIKAIVRELSCNAWDAHISANNTDNPFHVFLPSRLSPVFRLRDFGTGLTHDSAMNLFTTFFDSDKNDSNEVTGALGLGSKSPLGYTNNYSVTSYQNGKARVYNIYIADSGMPCCVYGGETDTNEPDGLEIQVPTKGHDSSSWKQAAERVYQVFPKGSYSIDIDITVPDIDIIETHASVDLLKSHLEAFSYDNWVVQMGNVAYPVDFDKLDDRFETLHKAAIGLIHVDMGEVMFTPDRDSLFYNRQTISALEKRLDEFLDAHNASYMTEQKKIKTLADWGNHMKRIRDNKIAKSDTALFNSAIDLGIILRGKMMNLDDTLVGDLITAYRGARFGRNALNELAEKRGFKDELDSPIGRFVFRFFDVRGEKSLYDNNMLHIMRKALSSVSNVWGYSIGKKTRSYWCKEKIAKLITPDGDFKFDDFHIFVNDQPFGVTTILRQWIREDLPFGEKNSAFLFVPDLDDAGKVIKWLSSKGIEYTVTYASECTDMLELRKSKKGSVSIKGKTCMILEKNPEYCSWRYNSSIKAATWNRGCDLSNTLDDIGKAKNHVWVEVKAYQPQNATTVNSTEDMIHLVYRRYYGIVGIVGVKKQDVALFQNDPKWTHVDDIVTMKTKTAIANLSEDTVKAYLIEQRLDGIALNTLSWMQKHINEIDNNDITDYLLELPKLETSYAVDDNRDVGSVLEDANRLNLKVNGSDFDTEKVATWIKTVYTSIPCWKIVIESPARNNEEVVTLFNHHTQKED